MPSFKRNSARRSRGTVTVLVLAALIALLGAVSLSIDNGLMLATRTQLQNAADAAALAAMAEVRGGLLQSEAINAAIEVAGLHRAGGDPVEIDASDVQFGSFDYATGTFTPGGLGGISAVRVTARRTNGSPGGPLDLFFAPLLGKDTANVRASSVAGIGTRDVMMAQDISRSFHDDRADAIAALSSFSNLMSDQSIAGDRLGLVSFNEASQVDSPLSALPEALPPTLDAISALDGNWCASAGFFPCDGTHIGAGLNEAIDTLLAAEQRDGSRVVVLVSDGVPCARANEALTQQRINEALAARDRAEAEGISTFAIYYEVTMNPTMLCQDVEHLVNPNFMQQMTTGFGQYFTTPNADELDDILTSILTETPLRVVK